MAINVTSSTSSATLRQTQQNQTQAAANDAAKETANREQQARKAQQTRQANKPEQPKPVVNTQGQVTGKTINVTA